MIALLVMNNLIISLFFVLTLSLIDASASASDALKDEGSEIKKKAIYLISLMPQIRTTLDDMRRKVLDQVMSFESVCSPQVLREFALDRVWTIKKKKPSKQSKKKIAHSQQTKIKEPEQTNKLFENFHLWAYEIINAQDHVKDFEEQFQPALKECILCSAEQNEGIVDTFKRMNVVFSMESSPNDKILKDLTYLVNEWILRSTQTLYDKMVPHILDCSTTLQTMRRLNEEMGRECEMLPLFDTLKKAIEKKENEDAEKEASKSSSWLPTLVKQFKAPSENKVEKSSYSSIEDESIKDDIINDAKAAILVKGTFPPFREIKRKDPKKLMKILVLFYDQIDALGDASRSKQARKALGQKVFSAVKTPNIEGSDQRRSSVTLRVEKNVRDLNDSEFKAQTLTHDAALYLRSAPKIFTFTPNILPQEQLKNHVWFIEHYLNLLATYNEALDPENAESIVSLYLGHVKRNVPQLSNCGYELFIQPRLEINLTTLEAFEETHKKDGQIFLKELADSIRFHSNIENKVNTEKELLQYKLKKMWFFLKRCEALVARDSLEIKEDKLEMHEEQFNRWVARKQRNSNKDHPSNLYTNAFRSLFDSIIRKLQLENVDLHALQEAIDPTSDGEDRVTGGVTTADTTTSPLELVESTKKLEKIWQGNPDGTIDAEHEEKSQDIQPEKPTTPKPSKNNQDNSKGIEEKET